MKLPPLTPIETNRLILRKFRMSDLEGNYRHITSDPDVASTMLWDANPEPAHSEEVIRRILSRYGTREGYRWAIALKEDDSFIGTISLLRLDEEENSCSFAYMLGKAFWNRGYMTEALTAVFDFAFSQMEVDHITADHFADNPASGAVMRKAGMRYIGTEPGKYEKHGIRHDADLYAITKEEWQSR